MLPGKSQHSVSGLSSGLSIFVPSGCIPLLVQAMAEEKGFTVIH